MMANAPPGAKYAVKPGKNLDLHPARSRSWRFASDRSTAWSRGKARPHPAALIERRIANLRGNERVFSTRRSGRGLRQSCCKLPRRYAKRRPKAFGQMTLVD